MPASGGHAGLGGNRQAVAAAIAAVVAIAAVGGYLGTRHHGSSAASQELAGHQAEVKSDLRNGATAEETYLTDNLTYTTNVSDLNREGFRGVPGVAFTIVSAVGDQNYCLEGSWAGEADSTFFYNSQSFGITTIPCT